MKDCKHEVEGYYDYDGPVFYAEAGDKPKTVEDVWQAAADYCVMFFNSNVIYEHRQLGAMVTLVGILLKDHTDRKEGGKS